MAVDHAVVDLFVPLIDGVHQALLLANFYIVHPADDEQENEAKLAT